MTYGCVPCGGGGAQTLPPGATSWTPGAAASPYEYEVTYGADGRKERFGTDTEAYAAIARTGGGGGVRMVPKAVG